MKQARARPCQRVAGRWLSALDDAEVSLTGSVGFRSHLHKGQRVATEYTIRPKETHFVLMQALIVQPPKITGGAAFPMNVKLSRQSAVFCTSFQVA